MSTHDHIQIIHSLWEFYVKSLIGNSPGCGVVGSFYFNCGCVMVLHGMCSTLVETIHCVPLFYGCPLHLAQVNGHFHILLLPLQGHLPCWRDCHLAFEARLHLLQTLKASPGLPSPPCSPQLGSHVSSFRQ
jgi:hypothetical protein